MKITKEFIHKHKSYAGGWTKKQLEAIGVSWPPQKGWLDSIIGKGLTEEQMQIFINSKVL